MLANGRAFPFPFVNDWARGCWVARPTGKRDRDYVWARDFLKGRPDKASGMVRYSLEDLGGPGWIVAKDRRRVRSIVAVGQLEWVDFGEVQTSDVLRIVGAGAPGEPGAWQGERCERCQLGAILEPGLCVACASEDAEREAIAAENAGAPEEVPF